MPELVSITDAARKVGLSRPRVSKLIKAYDIKKVKDGGSYLVDPQDIHNLVTRLRSEGKVKEKEQPKVPSKNQQLQGARKDLEPVFIKPEPAISSDLDSALSRDISQLKLQIVALESEIQTCQKQLTQLQNNQPKHLKIDTTSPGKSIWRKMFEPWG